MDPYTTLASWTGWPAIVAVLLLAGGYAYSVLHSRLELLKEKNEWLEKQATMLKECSPDVLAQRLANRLRILSEELERLNADQIASETSIRKKEAELAEVKAQIDHLKDQIAKAQDLLKVVSDAGLVCPQCGAPLETREYHDEVVEYEGRDIDVNHEIIRYECGLEIIDDRVRAQCTRSKPKKKAR